MGQNFKRYCKDYENIENYQKAKADGFKGWCCHHRLQTWTSDGERRLVNISADELKALGMYYNRPASELIFLEISEHTTLHQKGKKCSEETRNKMSEAKKNMPEETKQKIREAKKGKYTGEDNPFYGKHHSTETRKKMSDSWDYDKHHSAETKKKRSEAMKGMRFFNNGKINIRAKECPPGFVPGRVTNK